MAAKLGMDPLELRRQNVIRAGDIDRVSAALEAKGKGHTRRINSYGLRECIDKGAAAIDWSRRDSRPRRGSLRVVWAWLWRCSPRESPASTGARQRSSSTRMVPGT
jgi:CO/xanthine dehydrogenase Mo-binding subunit